MSRIEAGPIATRRLDLLPLRAEYAEEMAAVLADPALHAFTGGRPDTRTELRSRYERLVAGCPDPDVSWLNWVIRLRREGCLTGTVQATVRTSHHGRTAEVAWVVGTPWQRGGIATEAARALVAWLTRHRVREVTAHIHPAHDASAAVATAAGLTPTGEHHAGELRWRRKLMPTGE
ncbi:RimJ/RimL family protein N-acetyltransferase [Streptomonospora nanhaiensis]|uniref:RimJ/RimL family protein N-acetyltransferase n=1 Tax=Streptomonospora nanhaiensis TaxID=1323731 RepID=A0A853BQV6_9ACTN|nr:GNAT family N-acetyltransferase [Streptomonospora nanhaiensis]NYI97115.1 RimJ/RimL family protein N-acetyltransferase [Streptomonospora nanhaiensis]